MKIHESWARGRGEAPGNRGGLHGLLCGPVGRGRLASQHKRYSVMEAVRRQRQGEGGFQFMQWTQGQPRDVTVWVTYGVEVERMRWPVLQIVNYLEM